MLIARSDPTLNDRVGVAVYNEHGKVIFVGIGDLVEITEPVHTHQLIAELQPAYEYITWSPGFALTASTLSVRTALVVVPPTVASDARD